MTEALKLEYCTLFHMELFSTSFMWVCDFNANVGSLVVMLCIILWVYSHWNLSLSLIIVTGLSGR